MTSQKKPEKSIFEPDTLWDRICSCICRIVGWWRKRRSSGGSRRAKWSRPQVAGASYAARGGRCGDSLQWASLPGGRFALALSDGMGKGEAAARESSLAVASAIKLLAAGLEPGLAIRLLNGMLTIDRERETFPTMDLAILDRKSRELRIYKTGASPTIIRRRGKTEILAAPGVPLGVEDPREVKCVSTLVSPGDWVVMVSDGVVDSRRGDLGMRWVRRMLQQVTTRDPQTACDLIMCRAAANYGDAEKDDMTVAVMIVP